MITDVETKSSIYSNLIDDRFRKVITRWRLSNHKLRVKTGRYCGIPRKDRLCYICNKIEDEKHAIYDCSNFLHIRRNFTRILEKYQSVKELLDPEPSDIYEVALILSEYDEIINKR